MPTQPTPDMSELEEKLARAVAESRKELAHRNTVKALLAEPALPIPLALPRRYRDVVLEARGQMDCRWCFGSALNLENYQCLEPCEYCNGTGIADKVAK